MKAKEMICWKGVLKLTDNFDTWTTFDSTVGHNPFGHLAVFGCVRTL